MCLPDMFTIFCCCDFHFLSLPRLTKVKKQAQNAMSLYFVVMVLGSIEMRSKDVVNTLEHFSGQGSPRNKATNTP